MINVKVRWVGPYKSKELVKDTSEKMSLFEIHIHPINMGRFSLYAIELDKNTEYVGEHHSSGSSTTLHRARLHSKMKESKFKLLTDEQHKRLLYYFGELVNLEFQSMDELEPKEYEKLLKKVEGALIFEHRKLLRLNSGGRRSFTNDIKLVIENRSIDEFEPHEKQYKTWIPDDRKKLPPGINRKFDLISGRDDEIDQNDNLNQEMMVGSEDPDLNSKINNDRNSQTETKKDPKQQVDDDDAPSGSQTKVTAPLSEKRVKKAKRAKKLTAPLAEKRVKKEESTTS